MHKELATKTKVAYSKPHGSNFIGMTTIYTQLEEIKNLSAL
jgi:hypothetical protein